MLVNMRKFVATLLVLGAAAQHVAARNASPVEARLVVPFTKILPGVPFDMWIELYNPSMDTVHIAVCQPLHIRPAYGQINWRCDRGCYDWMQNRWRRTPHWDQYAEAILEPNERKTVLLPVRRGLQGPDVEDEFVLSVATGRALAIAVQLCLLEPKSSEPLLTNEVTVEILDPTGDDAAVWHKMLESADGGWTTHNAAYAQSLWNDVLKQYPDSNYVPYAALALDDGVTKESLDRLLDAMRRFPDCPLIDLLHFRAWQTAEARRMDKIAVFEREQLMRSKRPIMRVLLCPPENSCIEGKKAQETETDSDPD